MATLATFKVPKVENEANVRIVRIFVLGEC